MAEAEGSIIAIYLDHLAMFNMFSREGADLDERWGARHTVIRKSARRHPHDPGRRKPVTKKD